MSNKIIRRGVCQMASSIHSNSRAEIHDVPMDVIIRPFPAVVNEEKIHSLMNALNNEETEHTVPPIDVLWIKGSEGEVVKAARKVAFTIIKFMNYCYYCANSNNLEIFKQMRLNDCEARFQKKTIKIVDYI